MIVAFIFVLAMLAWVNTKIAKSFLYPPALFSTLWATLIFSLFLSGDIYNSISEETLMIYLLGAFMLSLGGLLILHFPKKIKVPQRPLTTSRDVLVKHIIDIIIVILLLAFPFYWMRLQELSKMTRATDFFVGVRMQTSTGIHGEEGFGIFGYLIAFATFATLTSFYMTDGLHTQKIRFSILSIITLIYNILSATRLGSLILIFGLIGIGLLRKGRLRIKLLIVGLIFFSLIYSIPAIVLKKGGSIDLSIAENVTGILESVQTYALSGLVAFDQVVQSPDNIESNYLTFRFFKVVAATILGLNVEIPSGILNFTSVPAPTNIYTIYYSYYTDFGLIGLAAIMFFLGIVTTWIFRKAITNDPPFVILYGLTFATLMLSSASEGFLIALSYWIQAVIFAFTLYRLPLFLWKRNGKISFKPPVSSAVSD